MERTQRGHVSMDTGSRVKDSEVVAQKVLERGVILIDGACFSPSLQQSPYLRLSCATVSEEECEKVRSALGLSMRAVQVVSHRQSPTRRCSFLT